MATDFRDFTTGIVLFPQIGLALSAQDFPDWTDGYIDTTANPSSTQDFPDWVKAAAVPTGVYAAPPVTTGMIAWYDTSGVNQLDGTPITGLADLSGNGHNLSPLNSSDPPVFHTNVINGRGAALVGGAKAFISGSNVYSALVSAEPVTICNVFKLTANPGFAENIYNTVTFGNTANMGTPINAATTLAISVGSQVQVIGFTLDTATHYAIVVYNGASTIVHIDGTAYTLTGNPGTSWATDLTWPDTTGGWTGMTGYECEWIYYNRALTSAEITSTEGYLGSKWA